MDVIVTVSLALVPPAKQAKQQIRNAMGIFFILSNLRLTKCSSCGRSSRQPAVGTPSRFGCARLLCRRGSVYLLFIFGVVTRRVLRQSSAPIVVRSEEHTSEL